MGRRSGPPRSDPCRVGRAGSPEAATTSPGWRAGQEGSGAGPQADRPEPKEDAARRAAPRRANTTDPHSRITPQLARRAAGLQRASAATAEQVVVAAEVTATTNDQPHFVPMATAVTENLTDAGHDQGSARSWPTPVTGPPPTAPPMSALRC